MPKGGDLNQLSDELDKVKSMSKQLCSSEASTAIGSKVDFVKDGLKNVKRVKHSRSRDKRFLTSFDMAEAKRAESILNSRIRRGELERLSYGYMCDCGCGASGCIIVNQIKK